MNARPTVGRLCYREQAQLYGALLAFISAFSFHASFLHSLSFIRLRIGSSGLVAVITPQALGPDEEPHALLRQQQLAAIAALRRLSKRAVQAQLASRVQGHLERRILAPGLARKPSPSWCWSCRTSIGGAPWSSRYGLGFSRHAWR